MGTSGTAPTTQRMPFDVFRTYAVAAVSALAAGAATALLWPVLDPQVSPLFFAAVMISAWYGGLGPGLVATALSVFLITYYFVEPLYTLGMEVPDILRVLVFLMVAVLISSLNGARKAAERALREVHGELERRVEQRTAELALLNAELVRSSERYRSFVTQSTEGIWRFELDEPVPINLTEDEQIDRFYRFSRLA